MTVLAVVKTALSVGKDSVSGLCGVYIAGWETEPDFGFVPGRTDAAVIPVIL